MPPRFYAPDATRYMSESDVPLPDDESAHLIRVLRLRPGDPIQIFDGHGREWRGEVSTVGRQRASVRLIDEIAPAPEPRVAITLAVAVLKGDKMDDIVRDAVMLGVVAVQPILTERTEISKGTVARSNRVARWQRIAVASAKQCGRAVVPSVAAPIAFADWVHRMPHTLAVVLVEPGAPAASVHLRRIAPSDRATLVIGPEGGWTPAELALAQQSGARLVTLGTLTLRADAAPIISLTALRALWGDL